MADATSILNLSTAPTSSTTGSSSSTSSGASCPIFYPSDLAALQGLPTTTSGFCPVPLGTTGTGSTTGQFPALQGYLAGIDDTLRFSILVTGGPKTVTFYGTRIDAAGNVTRFSQNVTGNSASTPATATIQTGPGLIQGVGATAVGGIGSATIYVLAELGDIEGGSFFPRAQLLSGLMTGFGVASGTAVAGGSGAAVNPNCWTNNCTFAFPSTLHWIQDTTPAAGTVHRCLHVDFQATMSAVAKNRTLKFILATEGGGVWEWDDPVFLTAGLTRSYNFNFGTPYQQITDALGNVIVTVPLPTELIFNSLWEIDVGFANPDAGDLVVTPSYCWQVQTC